RARDAAGVAVPLRWDDLARVSAADAFPLAKALARAKRLKGDPWQGLARLKQRLPSLKRKCRPGAGPPRPRAGS
ncbi:hypothetical protein AAGG40_21370, partial [Stenotrophomonas maltophilia]